MSQTRQVQSIFLFLSTGIAVIIIGLSLFNFYEAIELKLLDIRFKIRGPIATRTDIATVDIDVRALQEEGRFQDWSRDKHGRVVRFGQEHDVRMLAFDIYFPEPSVPYILARDLESLPEHEINSESVGILVRDYDKDMRDAMLAAENVYLASSFKPLDHEDIQIKKRSQVQNEALELLVPFYQEYADSLPTRLFSFYDIEPPIRDFITASKGVAYAQAVADGDGLIRRYPLVGYYDGRLFPSIALLMACDYLGVSFKDVRIIPGDAIILPLDKGKDEPQKTLRIPISEEGYMMVNWAGDWKDDFEHYPYSLVREFRETEHPNYILGQIKALLIENPALGSNLNALRQKTESLNLEPQSLVQDAISKTLLAGRVDSWLRNDEGSEPDAFFKSLGIPLERVPQGMMEFFLEIRENVSMDLVLKKRQDLDFDSLLVLLNLTGNARVKRNFNILKNLYSSMGTTNDHRPLYFYPSASDISFNERSIVPFEFNNKMLFYGLTATGTHDLNPMPYNSRYPMVGLHANALNTILDGIFIHRVPRILEIIMMLGISVIIGLIIPRFHPVSGAGITLTLWSIYAVLNFFSFSNYGVWLDVLGPSIIFLFNYVGITVYNYISQEKDKKFLHDTFKNYLSPELIDEMYREKQTPQLGGEEGIRTALFTDIQGFSSISEKLGSPSKLVEMLNEYLTAMTDILLDNRGTLDKYEGDAIIAFFGAPIPLVDHAGRACLTGLAMQTKLAELRRKWNSEGDKWPQMVKDMRMRIGINTGPIVTGNMGSNIRMNYTMIGDAVNVAARLESIAKQYGVYTICSGDSLAAMEEDIIVSRMIDQIRVMGKSEPVQMFELLGRRGELDSNLNELLDMFNEAYQFYLKQEWERGLALFKKCLPLEPHEVHPGIKTTPSRLFAGRCEEYLKYPPEADWDGVYTATSK